MKHYSPSIQNCPASFKSEKNEPFFGPSFRYKSLLSRWNAKPKVKWFAPADGHNFFLAISGIEPNMLQEILLFISTKSHENFHAQKALDFKDLLTEAEGFAENFPLGEQPFNPNETKRPNSPLPAEKPVFLHEVDEQIEANLCNEDFKGSDLARLLCCCEMQLYRKIKQLAKLSPANYIRRYRLRRSLQNLQESDLPITQVCFNVGFRSLEYFSRSFKKEFGVCPSAFRTGQNVEIVQANV